MNSFKDGASEETDIMSYTFSSIEASKLLPNFVELDLQGQTLPDGILLEHLKAFQNLYREHSEVRMTSLQHFMLFSVTFLSPTARFCLKLCFLAVHIIKLFALFKYIYIFSEHKDQN